MPDNAVLLDKHLAFLAAQCGEVRLRAAADRAWRVTASREDPS